MDEKEFKNNIPCIVDNGILYNPKDIQKVLRDLGQVSYSYIMDDEVKNSGEGYVFSVVANNSSANIIANKRLYLNVNGFEYMELKTENFQTTIDLVDQHKTIRLISLFSTDEVQTNDIVLNQVIDYSSEDFDDEELAEINVDDDYDDD